jgi:F-type H+-transporting ATPase subunit epsilon
MADKTFKLEIVTPERVVLQQDAVSVIVPGSEGSLGILANHAPLMAELTIGSIQIRDPNGHEERLAISGGFMEVADNTVRILADTAEKAEEIDVQRAEQAVDRARERLSVADTNMDLVRAEIALKRAVNRLRVAQGG